jgi:NADH-quinone oxidoreductase subunit L
MEGPTPVSALIHAATMVAAGVYMVGRLFPIFTPVALACIAVVGAGTALLAATIGIVQNDIKKVLAYSTVSQLGFMIMGLGAGGYAAGLFHLTTHAFFKALLFLGAGSVIHAMHHEQDMQRMGGLRSKLPITFGTMLVATLAIAGFWPFSGFFSKDAILAQVLSRFHEGGPWRIPAVFALLGATITSFYMFRLVFLTFFGRPRDAHAYDHAHESPWAMTAPLVLLAVLSVGSAWPKLGEGEARTSWFEHMLPAPPGAAAAGALARQGTLAGAHEAEHAGVEEAAAAHGGAHAYHALAVALGSAVAALGFLLAFATYVRGWISADAWAKRLAPLYDLLVHKYYFDEFYEGVVVRALLVWNELLRRFDVWVIDGLVNLTALVTRVLAGIQGAFDRHVVDGLVNGTASTAQALGRVARSVQTGSLGTYLALMVAGCLALMTLVVVLA